MKTWNGPTPFPDPMPGSGWTSHQQSQADKADGYRAAMNSPEVRGMYETIFELSCLGWERTRQERLNKHCKDYEAGLVEETP